MIFLHRLMSSTDEKLTSFQNRQQFRIKILKRFPQLQCCYATLGFDMRETFGTKSKFFQAHLSVTVSFETKILLYFLPSQ